MNINSPIDRTDLPEVFTGRRMAGRGHVYVLLARLYTSRAPSKRTTPSAGMLSQLRSVRKTYHYILNFKQIHFHIYEHINQHSQR